MEHAQVQLRGSHHAVALLHIRGYREPFMEEMLMELDIVKSTSATGFNRYAGRKSLRMILVKTSWS